MSIQATALTPRSIPISRQEETALMVAFQTRRDHASFEALYHASAPGMLQWIRSLHVQRRHTADPRETLQDAFLNIYRYAGSFRSSAPGGFRSWARTIAGNVLRRRSRDSARRPAVQSDLGEHALERGDLRLDPATAASLGEQTMALRSGLALLLLQYATCFKQLSERDQAALRMVEVEGRSYAEVGAALGTERSNTKMVVFRARKRLQSLVTTSVEGGASLAKSSPDPREPMALRQTA